MTKIIAIGDSITRWADDLQELWRVNRIRKHFDNNNSEWDIQVYNCWISGNTSEDVLPRFSQEIKTRGKNDEEIIIILAIGINDSQILNDTWKNKIKEDVFTDNIRQLIDRSKPHKIIILWLTNIDESKLSPLPRNTAKSYKASEVQKYDEILENICKEKNIPYIDLKWLVQKEDLPDWLHPNHIWHQKMAEKILKELSKI